MGRLTGVLAAAALAALAACSNGGGAEVPTATVVLTVAPEPTPAEAGPTVDPAVTVANVVQACREKDQERLRAFVAGEVSDEQIAALFARGTDVRLVSQTVPDIEGERVTVAVRLEISREDAAPEEVDRQWELERSGDGVWRFPDLPDCF